MRNGLVLAILSLCVAGPGCGPMAEATRTLVIQPTHYCLTLNALEECNRNKRVAEAVWLQVQAATPDRVYSEDYAEGFKQGFEDYLYAGPGNPPVIPPRWYWKAKYQTVEGRQAIEDWHAGFRHGTSAAHESGYRQLVVIPAWSSAIGIASLAQGPGPTDPQGQSPTEPVLPFPQKVPAPGGEPPGPAPKEDRKSGASLEHP